MKYQTTPLGFADSSCPAALSFAPLCVVAAVVALCVHAAPAWAEDAPAADAKPAGTGDAARDALAKKEGDVDQTTLLKETLTAQDRQYSLIKQGKVALTYDLSYSYIGSQKINAQFADGALSLFDIQNTNSHTITNTVSLDYGLRDNLTGSVSLPVVSKYSDTTAFSGITNGLGDISMGLRWQVFEMKRNAPTVTTSATLHLPTGRSPFEVNNSAAVSTGAGYGSATFGLNASKVIDPVALFGNVYVTLAKPVNGLSQQQSNGSILSSVRPGQTFGFGMGFAYALSYDISTTFSFQEAISGRTRLEYVGGGTASTSTQTSGTFNFGIGVRISPQTTVNVSAGIGLTPDTPDFTLGLNMPLNY